MNIEPDNLNDDGLNLKDLSEGAESSPDKAKRSSPKKKLVMAGSLLLLLIIVASGGYLLLSEKQLQVKATPQANGKDHERGRSAEGRLRFAQGLD